MKILVIPDCQVKPGIPTEHLEWAGKAIVDYRPDVVVNIGDFADMPSLSTHDKVGSKYFEGKRYKDDIAFAKVGMKKMLKPLRDLQASQKVNKQKVYKPRMVLTLGNHENRINRAIDNEAILDGTISTDDLNYRAFGWEVHPFLEVVEIDGIKYSHFFPRSPSGRVMQNRRGAPSARAQVQREMSSCTSGHLQGLDFHVYQTGSRRYYGLIAGSCYMHDEDYLSPQGTEYWRGIIMKHEVKDGSYDPMFVSLDYLKRRYS